MARTSVISRQHRTGRPAVILAAVITTVIAAFGLSSAPASADPHFTDEDYPPDLGTYHTYCYADTITQEDDPALYERIRRAEVYLENNTNVNVQLMDHCDRTGEPRTDVVWQVGVVPRYGTTNCMSRHPATNFCDEYLESIDKSGIEDDATHINYQYRKTACHELGHTVTLSHYGKNDPVPPKVTRDDCMRQGILDSGVSLYRTYESHHINAHINDWFCGGCTAPTVPLPGSPLIYAGKAATVAAATRGEGAE